MARMTATGALDIAAGADRVRVEGFDIAFGEPDGAEVIVVFEPPGRATLHVYGREIADGALTCSLGPRRAAVSVGLDLLARVLAEGLAAGLELPGDSRRALCRALCRALGATD
jgi:hypothetical protein